MTRVPHARSILPIALGSLIATGSLAMTRASRDESLSPPSLPGTARQDLQSTMTGVYTAPQAARGEETYMALCVNCHPAGTYKAAGFKATWKGRPLSDLFDQVREKMPKNDPGSLSTQEYVQLVAYILRINDVPPGDTDLPADGEVMKKIRIDMPSDDRSEH
ncbi:MAG TPA: cytochrome c [Vicinamibacterales bacterium]|nr:cytochrome c [Vicinamibacterales bacterium]